MRGGGHLFTDRFQVAPVAQKVRTVEDGTEMIWRGSNFH